MKKYFLSFISLIFVLCFVSLLYTDIVMAQTVNGIVITTNPEYPIPGSIVKVTLETYQFDVETAKISWYIDNKLIAEGIGKRTIELKYPDLGVTSKLKVVATINGDQNYVGGKVFGGATVNLLYEPVNSYVPVWYQGGTLPSEGGKVKLYAEAYLYNNKKQIPSENLIYNWTINEEPTPNISGMGKNSPIIDLDPIVGEAYVQLTVKSIDGLYEARASTRITPVAPILKVYYLNDEVFPHFMDYTYKMNRAETTLSAEPFYTPIEKNIMYTWTINSIPSTNRTKVFSIRRPVSNNGQVDFSLDFNNNNKLFQQGSHNGIIVFDK